jgi:hypothetical protein
MESPLMLSVARQLISSPRELYGPYGGSNPLVLIHAPLYYRVAALFALPMARAGLPTVEAARIAGRLISALSLVATMGAAYRLGRMGGLPPRAGRWAALMVAASPVLAGQPVAVRPDMAGVALQSWGVVLALESMAGTGRGPNRRMAAASVLFGLSACVKQHLVAAWAVSVALSVWGWVRGRLSLGATACAVLPGLAVSGFIYGAEWLVTAGRVWEATLVAAAHVGRVHPGDWNTVLVLLLGILNRSAGIVAMLAAAAIIAVARRPGPLRRLAIGVAAVVVGILLGMVLTDLVFANNDTGAVLFVALTLTVAFAIPAAALTVRSISPGKGIDAALWGYLAAELGIVVLLSRASSGAWINYGIPATVFIATLAARTLSHALDAGASRLAASSTVLAAAVVLLASVKGLNEARWDALVADTLNRSLSNHIKLPRSSYFFTGRPGFNRDDGRLELVYDDWLYPVFESSGLAEPRSRWLRRALASGPVRVVVKGTEGPMIDGTSIDLRPLGYRPDAKLEPYFYAWIR